jgi:hypothetical protein
VFKDVYICVNALIPEKEGPWLIVSYLAVCRRCVVSYDSSLKS